MQQRGKPSRLSSGVIVCLGMFVLGGAMLVAFFRVPRGGNPAPAASWGAPQQRLHIISCRWGPHGEQANLIAELHQAAPDYLLLQDISAADLDALAKALQLTSGDTGPVFYPAQENAGDSRGNAILATRPLYDGRSIPNPGGESFGVWATSIVDGRKFVLASIDIADDPANPESPGIRDHDRTSLSRAWRALHEPPMIVGGDAGAASADGAALAEATLVRSPQAARIDRFHLFGPWQVTADGVLRLGGPENRPPLWIDVAHSLP